MKELADDFKYDNANKKTSKTSRGAGANLKDTSKYYLLGRVETHVFTKIIIMSKTLNIYEKKRFEKNHCASRSIDSFGVSNRHIAVN